MRTSTRDDSGGRRIRPWRWVPVLATIGLVLLGVSAAEALTLSKNAGTCADNSGISGGSWSNPSRAQGSSDGSNATYSNFFTGSTTHYLLCTNFGFTIPKGSRINSITVTWRKFGNGSDRSVKIVQNGSAAGTDQSTGAAWPGSATDVPYSGGLWGATWTAGDGATTDVNSTGFGAAISAGSVSFLGTVNVDSVTVTIDYTPRRQQVL
jgi:hypothetical protein